MAFPVSRSRDIYSLHTTPPSAPMRVRISDDSSQDTLIRANAASFEAFSLSAIWDSIVDCFKSIFNYFFKSSQENKLTKIAARDHFICFNKQVVTFF